MQTISGTGAVDGIGLTYVTTVAGIVLAAVCAVSLGGWRASQEPAHARIVPPPARHLVAIETPEAPQLVFYIVASEAQANFALFAEAQADMARGSLNLSGASRSVRLLPASTQEEEAKAYALISETAADATGVLIYVNDLRGP